MSPLVSGLFYLSPGIGFLIGSVVGGKLSDRAVKKWIVKRNGVRLPQDRLNSGLATLFGILPGATLIYCWTLEEEVGGMVVPIIAAFFAGVGLLGAFNGLNTYSAGECCTFNSFPYSRTNYISQRLCHMLVRRSSAQSTWCNISLLLQRWRLLSR